MASESLEETNERLEDEVSELRKRVAELEDEIEVKDGQLFDAYDNVESLRDECTRILNTMKK